MSDLISREEVLKALKETYPIVWSGYDYELGQKYQWSLDELAILTVPSAESKTAVTDSLIHDYFECPYCGLVADKDERSTWMYCPSCGVKMPEILADSESEDKE